MGWREPGQVLEWVSSTWGAAGYVRRWTLPPLPSPEGPGAEGLDRCWLWAGQMYGPQSVLLLWCRASSCPLTPGWVGVMEPQSHGAGWAAEVQAGLFSVAALALFTCCSVLSGAPSIWHGAPLLGQSKRAWGQSQHWVQGSVGTACGGRRGSVGPDWQGHPGCAWSSQVLDGAQHHSSLPFLG